MAIAETAVGADGTTGVCGVTELDAADSGPDPFALTASTRNVYAVPVVRPVRRVLVAGALTLTGVPAVAPT
jgi:hypothetical protein